MSLKMNSPADKANSVVAAGASIQLFKAAGTPFQAKQHSLDHDLQAGEALLRIRLATICGSDLHTISGARREDTPCILGHEALGEIVELRDLVGFAIGDRVTWTIADSCGECAYCTTYDMPEKCLKLFKYGHASIHKGSGLNGCYSSHVLIRAGTTMVKIPDVVSDAAAAPANCALATMVNAIEKMTVVPESVVVQGGGLLGLYGCAILRHRGVKHVYCTEINKSRFGLIERFGATPIDVRDWVEANRQIHDAHPLGVDAVFEVAGVKQLVAQGLELLRCGGFYALVGLVHPDSDLGITAEQVIRKNLTIRGIHNYGPKHLKEAVEFLEETMSVYPYADLVSPPFPLAKLEDAVAEAKRKKWARVSIQP